MATSMKIFQKPHVINTVVSGLSKFTTSLYKEVLKSSASENVFMSPFSISVALAMTGVGAKENTLQELKRLLGVESVLEEDLHSSFSDLTTVIQDDNGKSGYKLHTGNRLFCQEKYALLQRFLEATQAYYKAEAAKMDFISDAEGSTKAINQWVEDQTFNKIRNLIPAGLIDHQTRMVLVNAIYFKGDWTHPFKEKQTRSEPFYISSKDIINVSMMHLTEDLHYHSDPNLEAKILELPYGTGNLSMFILLPEKVGGLEEMEDKLTETTLEGLITKAWKRSVHVSLPRFRIEEQIGLNKVLQKLGLVEIFVEGKADLSGMDGTKELFVSHVVHKAYVDVNEEGTEAAAATGVMVANCIPPPPEEFKADHPFLFIIRDNRVKATLFMGRLYRPSND